MAISDRSPDVRDVVSSPLSLRMLGGSVAVLGIALIVGNILTDPDTYVLVVSAIGGGAGVVVLSSRISTRVAGDSLTIWFVPILRIRVPLAQISAASIEQVDPRKVGGVGIARSCGGRVLCLSAGTGVRVSSPQGALLVQCNDAAAVVRALGWE